MILYQVLIYLAVFLYIIFLSPLFGTSTRAFLKRRSRNIELSEWASSYRWTLPSRYKHFISESQATLQCFNHGSGHYTANLMLGTKHGFDFEAFDAFYCTGSGKHPELNYFSGVFLTPKGPLKSLVVRQKKKWFWHSSPTGLMPLHVEPAFKTLNEIYQVYGRNSFWASRVLNSKNIEKLLINSGYNFEFTPNLAVIWRKELMSGPEFNDALNLLIELVEGISPEKEDSM